MKMEVLSDHQTQSGKELVITGTVVHSWVTAALPLSALLTVYLCCLHSSQNTTAEKQEGRCIPYQQNPNT